MNAHSVLVSHGQTAFFFFPDPTQKGKKQSGHATNSVPGFYQQVLADHVICVTHYKLFVILIPIYM